MSNFDIPDSLEGIAVIGLAGRFPKANNIAEFWQNLRDGVEAVSFFTDEELLAAGVSRDELDQPNYVKARAIVPDAEWFDASFFGFNPREAEIIDPQQRLFLECSWEALEDAGYTSETAVGSVAVYAGATMNTYLFNNLATNPELVSLIGHYQMMLSNNADYMPTRVSYKLNLNGPSINIQTACSTSLVTIVMACQSLLSYQCDMALAGGVSVTFPQQKGHIYQEGGIYSPDGHCRAFDDQARGTVGGQGVGVVVLKRLEDALADGDHVYAVIKGAAVNNDGAAKVGYTAPSVAGQTEVISMAHALAGVDADTIGYVETHGMATPLGDPIEIAGLTQAFRATTDATGFCAIGSVKTNIGHLDAAAGVASFIKTVLALEHKVIPPSLHYEQPNPNIDFANSPFYVNSMLSPWPAGDTPRRAGVNSFGIGGTNAHVVLEEAPPVKSGPSRRSAHVLTLSARSATALEQATANLARHLQQHPQLNLADVAYTLQHGRKAFSHRRILVSSDPVEAAQALQTVDAEHVLTHALASAGSKAPPILFALTGHNMPYVNSGLELYQTEATFREQVDYCAEFLRPHLGLDLRDLLYPCVRRTGHEADVETATEQLQQVNIMPAARFVIEYALARLWLAWNVQPQAMIGHGTGEYAAACLAGVMSLDDALTLVVERGQWSQNLSDDTSLATSIMEKEAQRRLADRGTKFNPPAIPFLSNLSGTWITDAEATDPGYWSRQLSATANLNGNVDPLLQDSDYILLEIGPGDTGRLSAEAHLSDPGERVILHSLRQPHESCSDVAFLLTTLGRLWLHDVPVDWSNLYAQEERQRVPLPTYPFERQRYWVEPQKSTTEIRIASSTSARSASDSSLSATDSGQTPSPHSVHARPELPNPYVAPRNELEQRIATLWGELLGIEPVGIDDNFFDLGGTSLLALRLFAEIEKRLGRKYPLAILLEASTVGELAAILGDKSREISWSSLVPIQREGTRPPFFCVHAAGGNVLVYRDLARHLGPDQPFYGLQSQGLDGSQPPLTTVEEMAALYVSEIRTVQPEGPYFLGGYCLGGTIALEMAQQLRADGQEVAFLGLFETYNWRNIAPDGSVLDVARYFLQKIGFNFRNFWQLDADGKKTFLSEKMKVLRRRSKTWAGIVRSRFDRHYYERHRDQLRPGQLWQINDQASLRYNPAAYPGRITHFVPKQEYTRHQGPELRWDNLAAEVEIYTLPTFPGAMLVEPYVDQTADIMKSCMDEALAATSIGTLTK